LSVSRGASAVSENKGLRWQTTTHGHFDPQRLFGALANQNFMAEAAAASAFSLTDEQRKRLVVQERG
jgi:hypothetical protein